MSLHLTGFSYFLLDINECSVSPSVCDVNANCQNNVGSYVCLCKPGFSGNGKTCKGTKIIIMVLITASCVPVMLSSFSKTLDLNWQKTCIFFNIRTASLDKFMYLSASDCFFFFYFFFRYQRVQCFSLRLSHQRQLPKQCRLLCLFMQAWLQGRWQNVQRYQK